MGTIAQQNWADTFNLSGTNANSCCQEMGGIVASDPLMGGIETCTIFNPPPLANSSFPNTLSCSNLEALSESAPSISEEASGSGFGSWLSGNLGGISDLVTGILTATNPADVNTTIINPSQSGLDAGKEDEEANRKKMITRIVVIAVLAVGAFFLYKTLKK